MDRIRAIKGSVRCYLLGWCSLIPLLGIGPALVALALCRQLRRQVGAEWNPARPYLWWGGVLAWIGISLSGGLVIAFLLFLLWKGIL